MRESVIPASDRSKPPFFTYFCAMQDEKLEIVYIAYWPLADGLTQATVLPVLRYLASRPEISSVQLVTSETTEQQPQRFDWGAWTPINMHGQAASSGFRWFWNVTMGVRTALRGRDHSHTVLWARGSMAGGAAALVARRFNVPLVVESFEPHSMYMVESGVWSRNGLKARFQRRLERWELDGASALITVSEHFRRKIADVVRPSTMCTSIPCPTDFDRFDPAPDDRHIRRKELWSDIGPETIVGIYVGKFGDIYYHREFFDMISVLREANADFRLVILTPDVQAIQTDHPSTRIVSVPHQDVPSYLNAADVAFCLVRQAPSKLFCSPIKVGEYLSEGLPVIISAGIGEDSDFIQQRGSGWVVDVERGEHLVPRKLEPLNEDRRAEIRASARAFRDATILFERYAAVVQHIAAQSGSVRR